MDQAVFVAVQIDISGQRGSILGGKGKNSIVEGTLHSPGDDLILWRVIERAQIEKKLIERKIQPADNGLSVYYSYSVDGGDGGLFPIEEPGQFTAELVAAFAHPSFLNEVGRVEVITSTVDPDAERGTRSPVSRTNFASLAQLEGRLVRRPHRERNTVWYVESGKKRLVETPTAGLLRFGDSWFRLIQTLPTDEDAEAIPDGEPLTLVEAAEGKIIGAWPAPETYLVSSGKKSKIINVEKFAEQYGLRWRTRIIHLRSDEIVLIPDGDDYS